VVAAAARSCPDEALRQRLRLKMAPPRQLQLEKVPIGYFGIMNSYWTRIRPVIVRFPRRLSQRSFVMVTSL
jgi:hypothetical protein